MYVFKEKISRLLNSPGSQAFFKNTLSTGDIRVTIALIIIWTGIFIAAAWGWCSRWVSRYYDATRHWNHHRNSYICDIKRRSIISHCATSSTLVVGENRGFTKSSHNIGYPSRSNSCSLATILACCRSYLLATILDTLDNLFFLFFE